MPRSPDPTVGAGAPAQEAAPTEEKLSDLLERWLTGHGDKTLGGLIQAGRDEIWLPRRWCAVELAGQKRERFTAALTRWIRRLERLSQARLGFQFRHRASNVVFGLLVTGGSIAAFVAPPFTGLDTLPALGVVLPSLGVLLEDGYVVVAALVVGAAGVALEVLVGGAAIRGLQTLF